LKNGKIIREGSTTNLMEQFKMSSIEDLFLAIIFAEDNLQKNTVVLTIVIIIIVPNKIEFVLYYGLVALIIQLALIV